VKNEYLESDFSPNGINLPRDMENNFRKIPYKVYNFLIDFL